VMTHPLDSDNGKLSNHLSHKFRSGFGTMMARIMPAIFKGSMINEGGYCPSVLMVQFSMQLTRSLRNINNALAANRIRRLVL